MPQATMRQRALGAKQVPKALETATHRSAVSLALRRKTREFLSRVSALTVPISLTSYGRGAGVGRGRGVGVDLGGTVGVAVGVGGGGVVVAVAVAVSVAVGVAVGV